MIKPFKPMLAFTVKDTSKLTYPLLVSKKIDGIRFIVLGGELLTRSLKPIPNLHCQTLFSEYEGLEGELIVGEPNDPDVYRKTNSGVMSVKGEPDVRAYIFDATPTHDDEPYSERVHRIEDALGSNPNVILLEQRLVNNEAELLEYEEYCLNLGYEGVMVRAPEGKYKFGRSTEREGLLGKLKRFEDSEALVIGFECLYKNGNEATTNELGYTERSSHKENKIPQDLLGKLVCRDVETGIEFSIGSGFTLELRKDLWENKDDLIGKLVTYKHFPVGVKEAPRFPTFERFRDVIDMEA